MTTALPATTTGFMTLIDVSRCCRTGTDMDQFTRSNSPGFHVLSNHDSKRTVEKQVRRRRLVPLDALQRARITSETTPFSLTVQLTAGCPAPMLRVTT